MTGLEHLPTPAAPGPSAMRKAEAGEATETAGLPGSWLDRLLAATVGIPVERGVDAVSRFMLEALAELVPSFALGLFVAPLDSSHVGAAVDPVSLRKRAQAAVETVRGADEWFADLPYERRIQHTHAGIHVTLVAASDREHTLRDCRPLDPLLRRAAELTAVTIHTTRLVAARGRESQKLQRQIIQSEKLATLGQLAAGIVHELNNPLTSIVGYADYLHRKAQREEHDPGDTEKLRRISEAATRILLFSRELMAYARPSLDSRAPTPLHAVIDQALVFCEHLSSQANITVCRAYAATMPFVLGVRDQLIQVFINLFTNACHAMPVGGTLTIRTHEHPDTPSIRIRVMDTGCGILPEDLPRLFEPFFTTKGEGLGTGLGLCIVRNIVLLHGGRIDVESQPRVGTCFEVELPLAR